MYGCAARYGKIVHVYDHLARRRVFITNFVARDRVPEIPDNGMYFRFLSDYVVCHNGVRVRGDLAVA